MAETAAPSRPPVDEQLPDTALFWRWVGHAVRRYVGWILVALGVLVIIIGYWGVSGQVLVAKQLPYVVSGGIFGLALVAFGTFYLVTEELRRDSGRLDRLERMVTELHAVLLTRADAPDVARVVEAMRASSPFAAAETNGANGNGSSAGARLVSLPGSDLYHAEGCPMVEGRSNLVDVTRAASRRKNLEPCAMCEPAVAAAV